MEAHHSKAAPVLTGAAAATGVLVTAHKMGAFSFLAGWFKDRMEDNGAGNMSDAMQSVRRSVGCGGCGRG